MAPAAAHQAPQDGVKNYTSVPIRSEYEFTKRVTIHPMAYRRSPLMQERLADNRERIVRATRRLIALGGFRYASMSAVANESGLSTGAIYRYFPSKSDLFVEVLTDAVTHEVAILNGIVLGAGSATERLRAAVESFASRALEGPHLAYAFIAEPIDPQVDAARIVCRQRFGAVFEKVLRSGIASGEFPQQSVETGAACIVGAFTEALVRPVKSAARTRDLQRLTASIADFCVRAALGSSEGRRANLLDKRRRARPARPPAVTPTVTRAAEAPDLQVSPAGDRADGWSGGPGSEAVRRALAPGPAGRPAPVRGAAPSARQAAARAARRRPR
jgi:AcrR family transcriptional regulator